MKKCEIWMSAYRDVHPPTVESICETIQANPKEYRFKTIWNDALVSRSRNRALTHFLEDDNYRVMVFIDDDIYFKPYHVEKLVEYCMNGYDMIGGFYPVKGGDFHAASRLIKGSKCIVPSNTEPVEAEYLGTGFMAINRRVIERMAKIRNKMYGDKLKYKDIESFYNLFEAYEYKGEWLSEDWGFCQRARDLGFKCWMSPKVNLIHVGQYCYTLQENARPPVPEVCIEYNQE